MNNDQTDTHKLYARIIELEKSLEAERNSKKIMGIFSIIILVVGSLDLMLRVFWR
jgi:hypothetical protein